MKKPIIGVVVGAAALFVWGVLSWMLLPWHNQTIHRLPEEQLISDTLKTVVTEPGLYFFPHHDGPDGKMDDAAWVEKYKRGPVGVLAFSPAGKAPMSAVNFVVEIIGCLLIATVSMLLLLLSRDRVRSIVPRAFLVASLALVVGTTAHLTYWNWFHFPLDFTLVNICDNVLGFLILGFAQAKFVPQG